jgi:ubiquinone/menaquinone biosynthesis C-methylase UbiE
MAFAHFFGDLHDRLIYQRRIRAISMAIAPLLPQGLVLDVGCGNGDFGAYLMSLRKDIRIIGLDVMLRPFTAIPVVLYDGGELPFMDKSISGVIIADTLHHTRQPDRVMRECLRVAREAVVVKDHFFENEFQKFLLRLLDLGGNLAHGVPSIYNYFNREQWAAMLNEVDGHEVYRSEEVDGQYPGFFQPILGRGIQFVSKVSVSD